MRARNWAVAALAVAFLFAQAGRAGQAAPATGPAPAATGPAPAASANPPSALAPKWFTSLDLAQAEARKSGKPILADFTGSDWCPWCIRLRKEVFDTKLFKEWAAKNVVLLELDFPRTKPQDAATKKANRDLAAKYKIEGFPTVLFLTVDGKVLGTSGYEAGGPAPWTRNAQKMLNAGKPATK
jgi:thiol-disulfide isomerase/thioredoxin